MKSSLATLALGLLFCAGAGAAEVAYPNQMACVDQMGGTYMGDAKGELACQNGKCVSPTLMLQDLDFIGVAGQLGGRDMVMMATELQALTGESDSDMIGTMILAPKNQSGLGLLACTKSEPVAQFESKNIPMNLKNHK